LNYNLFQKLLPFCPYHFVHTILSHTILSIYHFVRYHFVRSPSEALSTQHGYCVGSSRRSATGNCERRTCPRSLRGG